MLMDKMDEIFSTNYNMEGLVSSQMYGIVKVNSITNM